MVAFESGHLDEPPADADEWTNDQWIEWLKRTDDAGTANATASPGTAAGRVVRSAGGQLLGQSMLGLANALYGRHDDDVVVVAEANSDPEPDELFSLHLDYEHPERSFVVLKPGSEKPD